MRAAARVEQGEGTAPAEAQPAAKQVEGTNVGPGSAVLYPTPPSLAAAAWDELREALEAPASTAGGSEPTPQQSHDANAEKGAPGTDAPQRPGAPPTVDAAAPAFQRSSDSWQDATIGAAAEASLQHHAADGSRCHETLRQTWLADVAAALAEPCPVEVAARLLHAIPPVFIPRHLRRKYSLAIQGLLNVAQEWRGQVQLLCALADACSNSEAVGRWVAGHTHDSDAARVAQLVVDDGAVFEDGEMLAALAEAQLSLGLKLPRLWERLGVDPELWVRDTAAVARLVAVAGKLVRLNGSRMRVPSGAATALASGMAAAQAALPLPARIDALYWLAHALRATRPLPKAELADMAAWLEDLVAAHEAALSATDARLLLNACALAGHVHVSTGLSRVLCGLLDHGALESAATPRDLSELMQSFLYLRLAVPPRLRAALRDALTRSVGAVDEPGAYALLRQATNLSIALPPDAAKALLIKAAHGVRAHTSADKVSSVVFMSQRLGLEPTGKQPVPFTMWRRIVKLAPHLDAQRLLEIAQPMRKSFFAFNVEVQAAMLQALVRVAAKMDAGQFVKCLHGMQRFRGLVAPADADALCEVALRHVPNVMPAGASLLAWSLMCLKVRKPGRDCCTDEESHVLACRRQADMRDSVQIKPTAALQEALSDALRRAAPTLPDSSLARALTACVMNGPPLEGATGQALMEACTKAAPSWDAASAMQVVRTVERGLLRMPEPLRDALAAALERRMPDMHPGLLCEAVEKLHDAGFEARPYAALWGAALDNLRRVLQGSARVPPHKVCLAAWGLARAGVQLPAELREALEAFPVDYRRVDPPITAKMQWACEALGLPAPANVGARAGRARQRVSGVASTSGEATAAEPAVASDASADDSISGGAPVAAQAETASVL